MVTTSGRYAPLKSCFSFRFHLERVLFVRDNFKSVSAHVRDWGSFSTNVIPHPSTQSFSPKLD
jgi:hypothetical protein